MKRWIADRAISWLWRRLRQPFSVFILELINYAFTVKELRQHFDPEELEKLRSAVVIIIEKVLNEDLE